LVKHIHIALDNNDFEKLKKAKGNVSWADFLLGKTQTEDINEEN